MSDDIFDTILNLEDESYEQGYQLGVADGSHAGRIEGRVFGLEKGFEKFVEAGKLHGRACVWGARFPANKARESSPKSAIEEGLEAGVDEGEHGGQGSVSMARLPANQRLEKHIHTLYALVEPETLSTLNSEDAVSDFDDRFKRAVSKIKVIENILGEQAVDSSRTGDAAADKKRPAQATSKMRLSRTTEQGEKNIEDFGIRPSRP